MFLKKSFFGSLLLICNFAFATLNQQVTDNDGNQYRILNNQVQELLNGSNQWTILNSSDNNFIPKGLIINNDNNLNVIIKPYYVSDKFGNPSFYFLYKEYNNNLIPTASFVNNYYQGFKFNITDASNVVCNQKNYIALVGSAVSAFAPTVNFTLYYSISEDVFQLGSCK